MLYYKWSGNMSKKRKKRKLKIGRIILLLIVLIITILGAVYLVKGTKKLVTKSESVYLASAQSNVELYTLDENKELKKEKELARGLKVKSNNNKIDNNEKKYTEIEYEDNKYYVESTNLTKDKKISELTKEQREAIADYTPDKDGNLHPIIEKRSEARAALQNYQKLYGNIGDENKTTETVVTLESIKGKATAKISVIQKNNEDAAEAGTFIDSMADVDEEA